MKIQRFIKEIFHTKHLVLMVGVFATCFFGWIFTEITEEIWIEKEFFPFDQATSAWIANAQNPLGRQIFRTLTMLGGSKWLVVVVLSASGFLLYRRHRLESLALLGGFAVTAASVQIIKLFSARARPSSDFSLMESTMAFPSGHMALSLFVYGFLTYLYSQRVRRKSHALWIMLAGIGLAGLIGISRLYLNVHWLSDVLGGFALAAAYLCLCIGFLETRQRHVP